MIAEAMRLRRSLAVLALVTGAATASPLGSAGVDAGGPVTLVAAAQSQTTGETINFRVDSKYLKFPLSESARHHYEVRIVAKEEGQPVTTIGTCDQPCRVSWVGEHPGTARYQAIVLDTRSTPAKVVSRSGIAYVLWVGKAPEPTELRLTVNGHTFGPAKYGVSLYENLTLNAGEKLNVSATLDHPLPDGWGLEIRRDGDPGPGSARIVVCSASSGERGCTGQRPGQAPTQNDTTETVDAVVGSTATLFNLQVTITWKKAPAPPTTT
jgi:hypothetical protein